MALTDTIRRAIDRERRIRDLQAQLRAQSGQLREFELAHLGMYRRNADLTAQLAVLERAKP